MTGTLGDRTGLQYRVHGVRALPNGAFVLRFDRHGLDFAPGQHISVGPARDINMREYSVYSAPTDDYLEVLVKEVDGGYVSPRLHAWTPEESVQVDGPFGYFTIDPEIRDRPFRFIATGTGIAPFHCFARSYPDLDYTLLHGTRFAAEEYDLAVYPRGSVIRCVSRENGGDFRGRVTDWLRANPPAPETMCYLCGNCDMIYEAFDILSGQGIPPQQLFAEVYF